QILTQLVEMVERQYPEMIGAVSLLHDERLFLTAAPGLPEAVRQGLHEVRIGPTGGSCGAAAYWRETVLAGDIATDPLWDEHRELALSHQLAACWSAAVPAGDGKAVRPFPV